MLYSVILNVVKNLLNDNTLCALSLVGFEEMLRQAQHDIQSMLSLYVVILNEVKNLSDSTTVGPLETGRSFACAQDDIQSMLSLYVVILNEVKNLLVGNTLCALSLVGFEEMLQQAQHDIALM